MPGKTRVPEFKGKELEYYNALMKVRNQLSGQIRAVLILWTAPIPKKEVSPLTWQMFPVTISVMKWNCRC